MLRKKWKILLLFVCAGSTAAAENRWEQVSGPAGGQALCVTECRGSLFAGSVSGGIFRSDDQGTSWYHLDSSYAWSMTALASKGNTLFAGTRYSGLFLSGDRGETWVNVYFNEEPQARYIKTLAVFDSTVYAASTMNVMRSSDNGRTWMHLNEKPDFPRFYYCNDFAKIGDYLFACGHQSYGVITSDDNGATWRKVNTGLFDSSVYELAVIDSVLFAGTYRNHVFKSADFGKTWKQCNGLPVDSGFCYLLYADDTVLFASIANSGLWVSGDYGESWNMLQSPSDYNPLISSMVKTGDARYIGTGVCTGIYRIALDSMLISSSNSGFFGRNILSLSSDSNTLLASSYYYATSLLRDNTDSWINVVESEAVNAYACHVKGDDLYIGTRGNGIFHRNSTDRSEPVQQQVEIDAETYLDIRDFATIGRYTLACGGYNVICRKADGESLWKRCDDGITQVDHFTGMCENRGRLFLAGFNLYVSDDSGVTWETVIPMDVNNRFITVAVAENNVYASRHLTGVHRSSDNGETWNEPAVSLPYVVALATWKTAVFAGTEGGGIYMSIDSAETWAPLNDGMFNYVVLALTVSNGVLYAGTSGNGIFRMDLEQLLTAHASRQRYSGFSGRGITVAQSGKLFTVTSADQGIRSIQFYDLLGRSVRKIVPRRNTGSNQRCSTIMKTPSHKFLLKVHTEDGSEIIPVTTCK